MRRTVQANAILFRSTTRQFSTPAPKLVVTPELIKKSEDRIEKRRKFLEESCNNFIYIYVLLSVLFFVFPFFCGVYFKL